MVLHFFIKRRNNNGRGKNRKYKVIAHIYAKRGKGD